MQPFDQTAGPRRGLTPMVGFLASIFLQAVCSTLCLHIAPSSCDSVLPITALKFICIMLVVLFTTVSGIMLQVLLDMPTKSKVVSTHNYLNCVSCLSLYLHNVWPLQNIYQWAWL